MAEEFDSTSDVAFDPRDIVLRIPGEHFFCESIELPEDLENEDLERHLEDAMQQLSPFPVEHLQWGFHACMEHRKALLFGALSSKLRLLGWENLEIFRRVFPSFVSLLSEQFGKRYGRPTISFLWHEDSLTAAVFDGGCPLPSQIHSQTLTNDEVEDGSIEITRSKLLALFDLDLYEIDAQIVRTGRAIREKDGFRFEHLDEDFEETVDNVKIDADALWRDDVRGIDFKTKERKRRKFGRFRWAALLGAMATCCLLLFLKFGLMFAENKVEFVQDQHLKGQAMAAEVEHLEDVRDRLQQIEDGGIRPMWALEYLSQFRPKKKDPHGHEGVNPMLWFTYAKFPDPNRSEIKDDAGRNREEVILRGTGENLEVVNNYFSALDNEEGVTIKRKNKSETSEKTTKFNLTLFVPHPNKKEGNSIAKTDSESSQ